MDFLKLSSSYPGDSSPCNDSPEWLNQCAIRMSIALNGEGSFPVNRSTYSEPKCSHGHARGAESLSNWLWKNYKPAFKYTPQEAESKIRGKTGIIFIKDCFTRRHSTARTGDHIDIWDKIQMKSIRGTDLFLKASEIWFFSI